MLTSLGGEYRGEGVVNIMNNVITLKGDIRFAPTSDITGGVAVIGF